ncbi:MAG: hypothetical protein AB8B99_17665 [Phormidesmis sp.]
MRSLVGLPPIEDESQGAETTTEDSLTATTSLIDDEDFFKEETTQRKVWQQPWPKIAIVALPLGSLCLIAMFVLSTLGGIQLAEVEEGTEETAAAQGNRKTDTVQQQEQEIARLKTSNALGNQASILDSQPTRRTEIRPAAQPIQSRVSDPSQIKRPNPPTEPVNPDSPNIPTPRIRPVAVARAPVTPTPRQPVARSIPKTVSSAAPVVRAQPTPAAPVITQLTIDPFTQSETLAAIGSYGQVNAAINASFEATETTEILEAIDTANSDLIPILVNEIGSQQSASAEEIVNAVERGRPFPRVMEISAYEKIDDMDVEGDNVEAVNSDSFEVAQADSYNAGVRFIMRNQLPTPAPQETVIMPGIKAAGSVITPVAWAQDIQSTVGSIGLTEDLVSNGSVIMPAGTQLTVALSEISESGMMSLTVTAIILPERGYEHMQIPPHAITIQGAGGQVLMARDVSGVGHELRRLNRNQAMLGALGTVGSILNRPTSAINTVGVGGSASSTTYSSPNIIGAVLEGSANTMIAQRSAQNQQRVAELQQRLSVWVLEQGTNIELFINQPVVIGE